MSNIVSQLRSITRASFASELERRAAVSEARALLNRLESPWETGFRYSWIHPSRMACLRIAMELDLFRKWKAAGGAPRSEDELFQLVTCDRLLFSRVVCHLAATQMLEVVKPGIFGLTPFTSSLAEPQIASTVDLFFAVNAPIYLNLPAYLASNNYQNPTDAVNGNFKDLFGLPVWEWLKTHPEAEATIETVMSAYAANRPTLAEVYPTDELLKHAAQGDSVLLVDCGGGVGHDVAAFARAHPQRPGKLVLQDRPAVIENAASLDPSIEKMEYDFFTPQPIKGAATYYFHFVLHDWPDSDCKKILDNQRPSMKKGYSKLLIHEVVLDPQAPEAARTTSDITMMAMASGMERTAQQWKSLLHDAGFRINKIYSKPLAAESVIEAEPF